VSPRGRPAPRTARRLIYLVTAALLAHASAAGAAPVSRGDIGHLRGGHCPGYRVVNAEPSYSPRAQQRALHGRFQVKGHWFHLVPPVNWSRIRGRPIAVRGALQRMGWLDVLFYIYRNDPDPGRRLKALRHARALALDRMAALRSPHRGVDPIGHRGKIVGDRAPYLAYLARSAGCHGMLSRNQAKRFLGALLNHGDQLVRRHSPSNHGLFEDLGLGLLADYLPFVHHSRHWESLSNRRFEDTLRGRLVGREGVWVEHTTQYQVAATELARQFVVLTRAHRPSLVRIMRRMRHTTALFMEPDGLMTQFGDSNLHEAPGWAPSIAAGEYGLTTMPRGGYAVVSEPHSYLAVGASFHNDSHKQSDELSFQLFEDGHRVVSDGGRWATDHDRFRRFAVSARAHSVLTVGNHGFSRSARRAYGSGIGATGAGDGYYAISGTNPLLRHRGVRHHRLFLYQPGRLLVVCDRVRARRRHAYRRFFQLGPDIDIQRRPDDVALSASGLQGALYDAPAHGRQAQLAALRAHRKPIQGFTFPDFRVKVPRWSLRYRSAARRVTHVATFSFGAGPPLRATLAKGPGTTVLVSAAGVPKSKVSVTHHHGHLSVSESPPVP
jgi:hypothetical protein